MKIKKTSLIRTCSCPHRPMDTTKNCALQNLALQKPALQNSALQNSALIYTLVIFSICSMASSLSLLISLNLAIGTQHNRKAYTRKKENVGMV